MKNLAIIMAVGAGLLTVKTADAQIRLGVNLHFGNVGTRVIVAQPVQDVSYTNYDDDDDYYYLPDVEAYYDVSQQCYYYNDGEQWIHAAYLPGRYRNYDWRNARHYEVRAQRPYMRHDEYRTRFGGFDQRGGGFDNRYANRGGFDNHRDDNRGGFDNHRDDNRGWNGDNRGGQFNAPNRGNYGGQYENRGQQNQDRGNYGGQPQQNQYQNGGQQGHGRGNYGQQNYGGQPVNQNGGQQGQGRGNNLGQPVNQNNGQQGQGRGNGQPQNNGGQQGQDRGNRGDEHFAANKMGMMRPARF
ncbi:hypothetical protein [Mucilaginibacter polytrichastri]|nr:hypothetical protein [Mucilaginibacter polytrichastri]